MLFLPLIIYKQSQAHEHRYESVNLLIASALNGLRVAEVVGVEYGIAKAVGVNRVRIDEDMPRLAAMLKGLDGGGKVAIRLLHSAQHVTRA